MDTARPLLVFIMAALNSAKYIERSLQSVPDGIEVIVVDGGSKDGTVELARRFQNTRTLECPNTSIYEAWNIGIRETDSHWVGFLNSDDTISLPPNWSAELQAAMASDADLINGCYRLTGGTSLPQLDSGLRAVHKFQGACYIGQPGGINARIFRRRVFDSVGLFDEELKLASDTEWLFRCSLMCPRETDLPSLVYSYFVHSQSKTLNPDGINAMLIGSEHLKMVKKHVNTLTGDDYHRIRRFQFRAFGTIAIAVVRKKKLASACRAVNFGDVAEFLQWMLRYPGAAVDELRLWVKQRE